MAKSSTATVHAAREHARAQAGDPSASQVTIPATSAPGLPADIDPGKVVWDETLGSSGYASRLIRHGTRVRFTDLVGDTNLSLVLHHAARPSERLNVADTMKLQWNAYPAAGTLLLSDMGRVLCTILGDSDGSLDLLCGASTPAGMHPHPPDDPGPPRPSGRDRLLLGLAKHGLGRRDLPAAANLFTSVRVGPDGRLDRQPPRTQPGGQVTLRAELDLLVTAAVTPHPLDHRAGTSPGPVRITAWSGDRAAPDDAARQAGPEARRAFENTDDLLLTLPAPGTETER